MLTAASLELSFGAAEKAQIDTDQSADLGEALLVLARALVERHDPEAAHGQLERAIRCLTNGLGPDHSLTQLAKHESQRLGSSTPLPAGIPTSTRP